MGDRRARARGTTSAAARRVESRPGQHGAGRTSGRTVPVDPRQVQLHPSEPELLELQRSAGNAAVSELVQRARDVQRKEAKVPHWAPWMASRRPVLRLGDGPSPDVAQLQQALNGAVGGKPLRITGVFDAETKEKVKAYQKAKDYAFVTGVANKHTWWNLDKDAPHVVRQGSRVVLGPDKGDPRMSADEGTLHPTIKLGSKGAAVEELQQKLNTLPPKDIPIYLSTHGKFDKTTRIGVLAFQKSRKPPMKATGVVDKKTWAALDALAGPVKVGREEMTGSQRAEGADTGATSRFTWRLLPDRLQVTMNIKFTGSNKHPMVQTWKDNISFIWNSFKFVDKAKPSKQLLLDFVVGTGTPADVQVKVTKTPKDANPVPRSSADEWQTGDDRMAMAPHEFGHLIGLQDEYNKGPEQYSIVTGEQPMFGEVDAPTNDAGDPIAPEVIATEMRKAVSGPAAGRGKKAAAVVAKYGLVQGGFAQRVAVAYEKAYKGKLVKEVWKDFGNKKGKYQVVKADDATMGDDLSGRIPGRMNTAPDEADAVSPFYYDNRGIMGSMEEVANPSNLDAHDHPVNERHVRHFLEIVQANVPGNWKTVRR